jgi:hypothetical protein
MIKASYPNTIDGQMEKKIVSIGDFYCKKGML